MMRMERGKELWDLVWFSIKINVHKCFYIFLFVFTLVTFVACTTTTWGPDSFLLPILFWRSRSSATYGMARPLWPITATSGESLCNSFGQKMLMMMRWWDEMSSGSGDLQSDPHRQLFRQLLDGDFICSCRRLFGMRCKRISIFESKASGQIARGVGTKGEEGGEGRVTLSTVKAIKRQFDGNDAWEWMEWKTECRGISDDYSGTAARCCRLRSTQLTKR